MAGPQPPHVARKTCPFQGKSATAFANPLRDHSPTLAGMRTPGPDGHTLNKRLLIADDHAFVCWGVAKALSALDDAEIVATVSNGIEAIAQIRKSRPDCAVLDFDMPGANGLEVFLESRRWSPATRFVLLSGVVRPQTLQALVQAGVHGLCLKQGNEMELVDVVRQVLAGATVVSASARRLMATDADVDLVLTHRELAVLQAIARGHTNASAAEALNISPKTVDSHRSNLMRKFAARSTASLVLAAVRSGFVDPRIR